MQANLHNGNYQLRSKWITAKWILISHKKSRIFLQRYSIHFHDISWCCSIIERDLIRLISRDYNTLEKPRSAIELFFELASHRCPILNFSLCSQIAIIQSSLAEGLRDSISKAVKIPNPEKFFYKRFSLKERENHANTRFSFFVFFSRKNLLYWFIYRKTKIP